MNVTRTADLLGVSAATVSRICSGDRRPSLDLMFVIEKEMRWPLTEQAEAIQAGTYADRFKDRMEPEVAHGTSA